MTLNKFVITINYIKKRNLFININMCFISYLNEFFATSTSQNRCPVGVEEYGAFTTRVLDFNAF